MQRLLQVHYQVYQEVETLPAVRATTREELYRRLYLAKEYAAAAFDQPITLNDMADVAGLSPNHLLRMFKQLFHQTPYQYLTTQRLNQAQQLLSQTDRSVTDICFSVGFESLGAFSWLFRRRVGLAPTEYRRQNG
jgi:transcriptional regulator GlxA family with amidase domain